LEYGGGQPGAGGHSGRGGWEGVRPRSADPLTARRVRTGAPPLKRPLVKGGGRPLGRVTAPWPLPDERHPQMYRTQRQGCAASATFGRGRGRESSGHRDMDASGSWGGADLLKGGGSTIAVLALRIVLWNPTNGATTLFEC